MNNLFFGQDTERIPQTIISKFHLHEGIDMKYDRILHCYLYDFVGIVISENCLLVVFPKHYSKNISDNCSFEDAKILFQTIMKYILTYSNHNSKEKYYGERREFESDFPFAAFFTIYNYYTKYGLYREEESELKKNVSGKIDWKKTIQKSNVIVSDGNLIFEPLYSRRKKFNNNFISDCMIFAINNTLKVFPFFENVKTINQKIENQNLFENLNYVIRSLENKKREIFRDSQKKLIQALIDYFKNEEKTKRGGRKAIKISYFNMVWQSMINEYLNSHFELYDERKKAIVFNLSREKSDIRFSPKTINIDDSYHKFVINLDHYGFSDTTQYIFDSKYYYDIHELNYKQFTYDIVMGNSKKYKKDNLVSCLLLPGEKETSLNLDLKEDFLISNVQHQIVEQYLPPKEIMIDYIKK